MTTNTDQMRKIEALLRLAAKAGTPEEAALAAAKAAELGVLYGIDLDALGTAESRKVEHDHADVNPEKWVGIIAFAVAQLNACQGIIDVDGRVKFSGRLGNATSAKVQLEYLVQAVNRLNRAAVGGKGFTKPQLRNWRKNFRLGAASALAHILQAKYDALRSHGIADRPQANALVVAGYFDQEQAALEEQLGRARRKEVAVISNDRLAFGSGALAAKNIPLNTQVG